MDSSDSELQELRRLLAELTGRVFRIEQALNLASAPAAQSPRPSTAPSQTHAPAVITAGVPSTPANVAAAGPPAQASTVPASRHSADLESRIGSHWLNRIGIAAVLIGVSYFLKFAFDNNWIGPAGRIAIGMLAGIAVVIWSETFRRRGYLVFSYSLKAVGIGVLYLSLYAAFQVYALVPSGVAFIMMFAVTAARASGPPARAHPDPVSLHKQTARPRDSARWRAAWVC